MRAFVIIVVLLAFTTLSVYAHLKPVPEPVRGGVIPIEQRHLWLPLVMR